MVLPCNNTNWQRLIERTNKRSIVVCKENGIEYRLENHDKKYEVCMWHYDGSEGNRGVEGGVCDYILFTCPAQTEWQSRIAIALELKGTDVEKAYSQLCDTIEREKNGVLAHYIVLARVVARKIPSTPQDVVARAPLLTLLKRVNKKFHLDKSKYSVFCRSQGKCNDKEVLDDIYRELCGI